MCADKTLTVQAADEVAEISVLNGSYDRVAHGVGRLRESLPIGLYKLVVRVGPVVTEQLVSLDQDRVVSIAAPDIPSPIPFESSTHSQDNQREAAIGTSNSPRDILGAGASIFVFVREVAPTAGAPRVNPAAGLSLLDENGTVLCKIEDRAEMPSEGDQWAGWRADVSPGAYRVRLDLANDQSFERALIATAGKQTQLFMLLRDYGLPQSGLHRAADLAGGTVAISVENRFDASRQQVRATELATYALAQKRRVLSDNLINTLLERKFADPMQGLLGAHLLLRDHPKDVEWFETVTNNLVGLLGQDHPDVQALWLRRRDRGSMSEIRLRTPPMLRPSWELAAEESVRANDVIPSESPSGAIAFKVLSTGPWLVWRGDNKDQVALEGLAHDLPAATGALADYLKTRVRIQAERTPVPGVVRRITRGVRSLPGVRTVVGPSQAEQDSASAAPLVLSDEEKTEIARVLGVPGNAINDAVKRFLR